MNQGADPNDSKNQDRKSVSMSGQADLAESSSNGFDLDHFLRDNDFISETGTVHALEGETDSRDSAKQRVTTDTKPTSEPEEPTVSIGERTWQQEPRVANNERVQRAAAAAEAAMSKRSSRKAVRIEADGAEQASRRQHRQPPTQPDENTGIDWLGEADGKRHQPPAQPDKDADRPLATETARKRKARPKPEVRKDEADEIGAASPEADIPEMTKPQTTKPAPGHPEANVSRAARRRAAKLAASASEPAETKVSETRGSDSEAVAPQTAKPKVADKNQSADPVETKAPEARQNKPKSGKRQADTGQKQRDASYNQARKQARGQQKQTRKVRRANALSDADPNSFRRATMHDTDYHIRGGGFARLRNPLGTLIIAVIIALALVGGAFGSYQMINFLAHGGFVSSPVTITSEQSRTALQSLPKLLSYSSSNANKAYRALQGEKVKVALNNRKTSDNPDATATGKEIVHLPEGSTEADLATYTGSEFNGFSFDDLQNRLLGSWMLDISSGNKGAYLQLKYVNMASSGLDDELSWLLEQQGLPGKGGAITGQGTDSFGNHYIEGRSVQGKKTLYWRVLGCPFGSYYHGADTRKLPNTAVLIKLRLGTWDFYGASEGDQKAASASTS